MAFDIRSVLGGIKTAIEALTPVTGSATYAFLNAYVANDEEDIPANIKHRAIIPSYSVEARNDVSSGQTIWAISAEFKLIHDWKRNKYHEALIVQREDVHQLIESMKYQRPGNASGVRIWNATGEDLTKNGNRWITTLDFEGIAALTQVENPS